jgi:hypothetical protein
MAVQGCPCTPTTTREITTTTIAKPTQARLVSKPRTDGWYISYAEACCIYMEETRRKMIETRLTHRRM